MPTSSDDVRRVRRIDAVLRVVQGTGWFRGCLAVWGLVGYAIHLGGSVLEVLGFGLNLMHIIPGGLWELFIGVWLIVKGFNVSSPVLSQRPTSASTGRRASPEVVGAAA